MAIPTSQGLKVQLFMGTTGGESCENCRWISSNLINSQFHYSRLDLETEVNYKCTYAGHIGPTTPSNTVVSLRELLDTLKNHIRGLESLGNRRSHLGISLFLANYPQSLEETYITRDHSFEQWNIDELLSAIGKETLIAQCL